MISDQDRALHHREQIERLAEQFAREFKAGNQPKIEDFLQQHTELSSGLLAELLAVEVELRRAAGGKPDVKEYRRRFPENGDVVTWVFDKSGSAASTIDHGVDTSLEDEDPTPDALGRYEVRHVLGRGGFLAFGSSNVCWVGKISMISTIFLVNPRAAVVPR
ncbi:MAG: hypothetical protein RIC12_00925 [Pirellulales bacterium]